MPKLLLYAKGNKQDILILKASIEAAKVEASEGLEIIVQDVGKPFQSAAEGNGANVAYSYKDSVVEVNGNLREVKVRGQTAHLQPKAFDLLALLTSKPRALVSYESISKKVLCKSYSKNDSPNIRWYVRQLRKAIETGNDKPQYIKTLFGRGCAYVPPEA